MFNALPILRIVLKYVLPLAIVIGLVIYILILKLNLSKLEGEYNLIVNKHNNLESKLIETISYNDTLVKKLDKQSMEILKLNKEAEESKIEYENWLLKEKKYTKQIEKLLNNKKNGCECLRAKIKNMGKLKYEDF